MAEVLVYLFVSRSPCLLEIKDEFSSREREGEAEWYGIYTQASSCQKLAVRSPGGCACHNGRDRLVWILGTACKRGLRISRGRNSLCV
jgi:hypothetical protein